VYEFFPHYREAVIRELLERGRHSYVFFGGRECKYDSGLKCWTCDDPDVYVATNSIAWAIGQTSYAGFSKRLVLQTKVIALSVSRRFDVVIYLGDAHYITTWISAGLARLFKKRVLFWTIGWLRDERNIKDWVRRAFYWLADGLLLYGHYAKKMGIERGFPRDRLYVVYNSLDFDRQKEIRSRIRPQQLSALRSELFVDAKCPILVCCGRLQPHRRLDWLISAVGLLNDADFRCNVLLIGDGPERDRIAQLAADRNVVVKFVGACYDEERLAELIMAADVTVAPGMVGLAAMQSLAYGTPVITHGDYDRQSPEWEAVVPGETGGIYVCGDIESLASEIRKWVEKNPDREDVARRCFGIVEQYFNPRKQREIIERAIEGLPAQDDTYWESRLSLS